MHNPLYRKCRGNHPPFFFPSSSPVSSTARNAFWGMSTEPIDFIRFLPAFCFTRLIRLRVLLSVAYVRGVAPWPVTEYNR